MMPCTISRQGICFLAAHRNCRCLCVRVPTAQGEPSSYPTAFAAHTSALAPTDSPSVGNSFRS